MDINEAWEKFGSLTKYKSKEDFVKDSEKLKNRIDNLTEIEKEELKKITKDFLASLDLGYTLEERLKRQYRLQKFLNQTDKTEDDFIKECKSELSSLQS